MFLWHFLPGWLLEFVGCDRLLNKACPPLGEAAYPPCRRRFSLAIPTVANTEPQKMVPETVPLSLWPLLDCLLGSRKPSLFLCVLLESVGNQSGGDMLLPGNLYQNNFFF